MAPGMTPRRLNPGITLGVAAYAMWGLLPLYIRLLRPMPGPDILAHRILWSLLLLAILAAGLRHGAALAAILRQPRLLLALTASATLIAINWLFYIVAVTNGHVADASLGYFINPLVNVVLGVVVLRERLGRLELIAVLIAAAGVAWLAISQGTLPLLPLTLALSFGFYGLVRKMVPVDAIDGLLIETLILAPFALAWLLFFGGAMAGPSPPYALVIGSGLVTALPLLLFAAAAKRIRYADLGLLQYIAPTLQLLLAVFLFDEHLSHAQWLGFITIWIALAIYATGATLRSRRESVADPD